MQIAAPSDELQQQYYRPLRSWLNARQTRHLAGFTPSKLYYLMIIIFIQGGEEEKKHLMLRIKRMNSRFCARACAIYRMKMREIATVCIIASHATRARDETAGCLVLITQSEASLKSDFSRTVDPGKLSVRRTTYLAKMLFMPMD